MGTVWLTADLHLGHLKICEMTGRPFTSVKEMNETLIANYNARVQPEDTCFFLGDVAMGQLADSLPLVGQMNGRKLLILGNHDRPSKLYHHKTEEKRAAFTEMYRQYFEEMSEEAYYNCGFPFRLHHLPYFDPDFVDHAYEGRYSEHQPVDQGHFLLHGHVHNAWKRRGRMINVGVDVWDYKPVHINQIIELCTQPV